MLPINLPMEVAANVASRAIVRHAERVIDARTPVIERLAGRAARMADANTGTLLISSGYAGSTRGLGPIARSAARDGLDVRRFEIPDGGLGPLADAARGFDELVRSTPGRLHLAGHSKGGAVVQEWWRTATAAHRDRVASMTLLASTAEGQHTPLLLRPMQAFARTVGGPASTILHELSSTSPQMRRIAALDIPSHTRAMSIISTADGLLSPREAAWRGARNVVIDGPDAPSHMDTLADPRAYAALLDNVLGAG